MPKDNKNNQSIVKKWQFWVVIGVAAAIIIGLLIAIIVIANGKSDTSSTKNSSDETSVESEDETKKTKKTKATCKTGDKVIIARNGTYYVGEGADIEPGTYDSGDAAFNVYKDEEKFDEESDGRYIYHDTVQLREGNVVGDVLSGGTITCK